MPRTLFLSEITVLQTLTVYESTAVPLTRLKATKMGAIPHEERRRGAHLPCLGREPVGG